MPVSTAVIASTARLLMPLIKDLYSGAKKFGARGLLKWEEISFPRKLARRLRTIEDVKTLWSPDKEISLLDFYYAPRVRIDTETKVVTRISEIGDFNFVIEGIVGQGKSMLLRSLAINEIISNDAKKLPVFIELRTLSPKLNLKQAIFRHLSNFDIELDDDSLDYLHKSGKLCYLLDGFDELEESIIKETVFELENLAQKYPELQIIITSRPGNEIQKSTNFQRVRISPLQTSDYSPFLVKLKLGAVKISAIKEAIKNSPSKISNIITTPLMLTLVVLVYESEKEIPETLPEFFEQLFRVVFTRHDKLKLAFERKHHSGLSERRLQKLFESFCFMAMRNGFTRSLTTEQFTEAFDQALSYTDGCKCELDKFRLDITKVACLMLDEGLDSITFLHKSIMEYYAAAFIKHSTDEVAAMFYKSALEESQPWWEVLSFLKDIDPYRFSKYFALPEVEKIESTFFQSIRVRDDATLTDRINQIYPELSIRIMETTTDKNTYSIQSYGYFPKSKYMGLKDLDQLIINALDLMIENPISKSTFTENFPMFATQNFAPSDIIELPVTLLLNVYGTKYFWQAMDILDRRIEQKRENSKEVIASHERRKQIFLPPLKDTTLSISTNRT